MSSVTTPNRKVYSGLLFSDSELGSRLLVRMRSRSATMESGDLIEARIRDRQHHRLDWDDVPIGDPHAHIQFIEFHHRTMY
jgi:hypothetical protein